MKHALRVAAAAAAVIVGTTGALTGTAFADGSSTSSSTSTPPSHGPVLTTVQQAAGVAINLRLSSLQSAISAVKANTIITSADQTTLLTTLNGDLSGLTLLGPKIQADSTAAQALADYRTIFTQYRVYALALPQVRFAEATDDVTGGVVPRLTDAQSKLVALLNGVESNKDNTAIQADMTDLASQIQAITTATNGLSASVLAYTPAQYDSNPAILSTPVHTLVTVHSDANTARQDIANVLEALQ
jgi:hypothetical protein